MEHFLCLLQIQKKIINYANNIFLNQRINDQNEKSRKAISFIDKNIESLENSVENNKIKLKQFREENKSIDVGLEIQGIIKKIEFKVQSTIKNLYEKFANPTLALKRHVCLHKFDYVLASRDFSKHLRACLQPHQFSLQEHERRQSGISRQTGAGSPGPGGSNVQQKSSRNNVPDTMHSRASARSGLYENRR